MSTEQNTKSWIPLEFYLGTALGFLLASLMLNATYGWASGLYPIPVLVTAIVGFIVGKIRQGIGKKTIASQRYFKYRLRSFLVICLLCALGPYCVMKTYYWVQATILPVPPGWTRTSVRATVLGWDNEAGFFIKIEGQGEQEALQFYRQYFEKNGWVSPSAITTCPPANSNTVDFSYVDQKRHRSIYVRLFDFNYDHRSPQKIICLYGK